MTAGKLSETAKPAANWLVSAALAVERQKLLREPFKIISPGSVSELGHGLRQAVDHISRKHPIHPDF